MNTPLRVVPCGSHGALVVWLAAFLCLLCLLPVQTRAEEPDLMDHPAWHRLDALSGDLPFAWARRYLELKAIAEDADTFSQELPSQLQRLREVTVAAQREVVTLLLDMVPAQSNVQETSFILGQLSNWSWWLELALRRTNATAAGVQHSLEVLEGIGQAVEEMKDNPVKRPVMEKASQDYYDLYIMIHQRVLQLNGDLNAVRSVAIGLYTQIRTATETAEGPLLEKWVAYYTTPLVVTRSAFARLGTDFLNVCRNLTSDEEYPASVPFAIVYNVLIVLGLMLASTAAVRVAGAAPRRHEERTFAQSLCCEIGALDRRYKLAFDLCVIVTLNCVVDTLPQFPEGIPYLVVQHLAMTLALALWARRSPQAPESAETPKVWELALPIMTGLLVLHGDAGPLLVLLGMGGALLIPLISLLFRRAWQSGFHLVWLGALLVCLLLTVVGIGRLTVPVLMLVVAVRAATSMLRVVNNSPALLPYTRARTWFVPVFTLFLCMMCISYLVGCSGLPNLRAYWYANAVPIMGFNVTFGDVILAVLLLLGGIFISNISRQLLENLGHESRIIDASAVPVLHVVINCIVATVFGCILMSNLDIDVTSLAFIGGGVSIGVGLAAKTVLSNFFCGLVLIFSKAVRSGDIVEIDGVTGRVLSVNMRSTVIETTSNSILLVPNENMLDNNLINWSLYNLHALECIPVKLAADSDVHAAAAAMEAAAAGVPGVMAYPPPKALFSAFGDGCMDVTLQVWVQDVRTRATILSEVRKALLGLSGHNLVLAMHVTKRVDVGFAKRQNPTL